jgi:pyridinium-3,5-biscarboxylic acid mononucleotide sulfurtransferase
MDEKLSRLKEKLREYSKVAIAFSGGVDSSFLVKVAYDVLGTNMVAVTAKTSTLSKDEYEDAVKIAKKIGCEHVIIKYEEMDDENFRKNPSNRCYFCKSMLFNKMINYCKSKGFEIILEGTNKDDMSGHRPGLVAAKEKGVRSPMVDVGLEKEEIRSLSKKLGLETYDKPEMACLSSRIPTDQIITFEKLSMVDKAESFVKSFGVKQLRVRLLIFQR